MVTRTPDQGGLSWVREAAARAAEAARSAAANTACAVARAVLLIQPTVQRVEPGILNLGNGWIPSDWTRLADGTAGDTAGAVSLAVHLASQATLPVTRRLMTDFDAVGYAWDLTQRRR